MPLLGIAQIVSWGSSLYLLAVLAAPISADTGWPLAWVVGGGSIGLLCSGVAAPFVGRMIDGFGGRHTMAAGSLLMGAGLAAVGSSTGLATYLLGWAVLGFGMGAGLYDAAFSTLGRIFGASARRAITNLTLFGGFASTVCWPLTALAVEHVGWRGACFVYAAVQMLVMAPALFLLLPREARKPPPTTDSAGAGTMSPRERETFLLLAAILMANGAVQTTVSVHLLTILQDRGMSLAAAVAVGALIGPSQVGARGRDVVRRAAPPDRNARLGRGAGGPRRGAARARRRSRGGRRRALRRWERRVVDRPRHGPARAVRPRALRGRHGAARGAELGRSGSRAVRSRVCDLSHGD